MRKEFYCWGKKKRHFQKLHSETTIYVTSARNWKHLQKESNTKCNCKHKPNSNTITLIHRALAAQDFRHTIQGEAEPVADFIRRLEQTFRIAYGKDSMSTETRDTLLHGQLQEGLKYTML